MSFNFFPFKRQTAESQRCKKKNRFQLCLFLFIEKEFAIKLINNEIENEINLFSLKVIILFVIILLLNSVKVKCDCEKNYTFRHYGVLYGIFLFYKWEFA